MHSFKGTDETAIELTQAGIDLIKSMLSNTQIGGPVIDVGDSLDDHFGAATPGKHALSHDQLTLLMEIIRANKFDKRVRKDAAVMTKSINAGVQSFYKED